MSTQLLIYETAVPVSSGRHAKASVEAGKGYAYARKINSAPLMAVEFPQAAADYAIVFASSGDALVPVVILGARQNENLYVNEDDSWKAGYVPAFLRRYPFVFSSSEDGKTFTLCVDEAFQGLNYQGRGQALFGADGKATAYVDNVLKFLQEYRVQFERTRAFCARLKALDLVEPMQAQFTLPQGEKMTLTGFHVVDRARLKKLPGEKLAQLAATDELELIYLHLQSMRNFDAVKDRLVRSRSVAATSDEAPPEEPASPVAAPAAPPPAASGRRSKGAAVTPG